MCPFIAGGICLLDKRSALWVPGQEGAVERTERKDMINDDTSCSLEFDLLLGLEFMVWVHWEERAQHITWVGLLGVYIGQRRRTRISLFIP